jgi:hypothetical protein
VAGGDEVTGETDAAPSRDHDDEQLDDLQRRLDELVLERARERRDPARADWLQTRTGRKVFPLDLHPEDVAVEDIAHALSLQCRFAGHTRGLYSVGQHSLLVADYLERRGESPEVVLWGLLHDASEAYLSDIPRPLKRRPEFAFYREAEARAMRAICARFGMAPGEPSVVKHADGVLLATEARDLMAPLHPDWHHQEANGFEVLPQSISPRWWAEVEWDFLARFDGLLSALDARLLASMGRTVTSRARGTR